MEEKIKKLIGQFEMLRNYKRAEAIKAEDPTLSSKFFASAVAYHVVIEKLSEILDGDG